MITSEEFREASSLGKEMIDGERALQDVAVTVSRASGVKSVAATAPTRTSRDVQRKKAVSEQINLHGMVDILGDSASVKGKFFSRFNVAKGHDDYKYAMCKTFIEEGLLYLARCCCQRHLEYFEYAPPSFHPPRRTVRRTIGPRGQKTDCSHW